MSEDHELDWKEELFPEQIEVGDLVKVCFKVKDHNPMWLPKELRKIARHCVSEPMWVEITYMDFNGSEMLYEGKLLNIPILIHPNKLAFGSTGWFRSSQVYAVGKKR